MTYGSQEVPLVERPHWQPVFRCPYRRLRELTPTTTWFDLNPPNPDTLWETHAAQPSGTAIHPGVLAAQELINTGARHAYVVEAWDGRNGVMRADLHGASADEPIHGLIDQSWRPMKAGLEVFRMWWPSGMTGASACRS